MASSAVLPVLDKTQDRESGVINAPGYIFERLQFKDDPSTSVILSRDGTVERFVEIPAKRVWNPARTLGKYKHTDTKSANAALFNWQAECSHINKMEFLEEGGNQIMAQFGNHRQFTLGGGVIETSRDKFMTAPSKYTQGATSGNDTELICRSNALATSANSMKVDGTQPSLNYTDKKYLVNGGANQDIVRSVNKPLGEMFPNTFFTIDRDVCFHAPVVLKFTWEAGSKYSWTSTSGLDPTAGAAAKTTDITISEFSIELAIQTNKLLADKTRALFASGVSFPIPFIAKASKLKPNADVIATPSVTVPASDGSHLRRVYVSVFPADEGIGSSACNLHNTLGEKIVRFRTQIDAKPIQTYDIDCKKKIDYDYQRKRFAKSAIQDADMYQNCWTWIDSWDGIPAAGEEKESLDKNVIVGGIPIKGSVVYAMDVLEKANSAHNFYFWVVTQKLMQVQGVNVKVSNQAPGMGIGPQPSDA